jgi:hypothetical protein
VGVDLDENTERIAGAFDFAGIGYAQALVFLYRRAQVGH